MTDYVTITGVRKRSLSIPVKISNSSFSAEFEYRVTRASNARVTRGGNFRVSHSSDSVYLKDIDGVQKRSFSIPVRIAHV